SCAHRYGARRDGWPSLHPRCRWVDRRRGRSNGCHLRHAALRSAVRSRTASHRFAGRHVVRNRACTVSPTHRLISRLRSAVLALLFLVPARPSFAQGPPTIDAFPFTIRYTPGALRFAERVAALATATPPLPGIPDSVWRRQRINIVLAPSEQAFAL